MTSSRECAGSLSVQEFAAQLFPRLQRTIEQKLYIFVL